MNIKHDILAYSSINEIAEGVRERAAILYIQRRLLSMLWLTNPLTSFDIGIKYQKNARREVLCDLQ